MLPPALFDVCGTCDRLGRLRCTEGNHGIGWFCLSGFKLQVLLEDNVQIIDLRKLLTLSELQLTCNNLRQYKNVGVCINVL